MPRRGRKRGPQEAEAWQSESHTRLSARAKSSANSGADLSYSSFERLATRPIEALASGEPIAPGEVEVRRSGEQASRYHYRTSQEGQMAAGFEPHRHSVMICGRPVQVAVARKPLECVFPSLALTFCAFLFLSLPPACYLRQ